MNLMSKRKTVSPARRLVSSADAARDARDWPSAARDYAAALALEPGMTAIWVQYGHAQKESGDLDGAGEAYGQALSRDPNSADTNLQMGHLRKLQGRTEDAAEFYIRAAEIDPSLHYALQELRGLSNRGVALDADRVSQLVSRAAGEGPAKAAPSDDVETLVAQLTALMNKVSGVAATDDRSRALFETLRRGVEAAGTLSAEAASQAVAARTHMVFDISDLVSYFDAARLPTGIQRVQIEVISALLKNPQPGLSVSVCTFSRAGDRWSAVPAPLFLRLCGLALASGDRTDPVWTAAVEDLKLVTGLGAAAVFQTGAYLINLGTSWWLQNYFLHVRQAKDLYGIHYIPFVHDMIPIMTPEHCVKPLTQDFISWALGVFAHADHFLTNSKASRKDLISVAETLGYTLDEANVHVVALNADFRKPITVAPVRETMSRYGLKEGEYVLFVSTIESRKNHLNTFKAWQALIQKHGAAKVPRLVCVGNRGWLNDAVFEKLETAPELRSRVLMISGVSDPDLANLYRACAFTIYPSSYEGWGLPVTESLCYGKAVLLSDASSLPEAGGDFGVYFSLNDQAGFVQKLDRLMFDLPYRQGLERRISAEFKPRPWSELGVEIADRIATWFEHDERGAPTVTPRADMGRYYWLRRVNELAIYPNMVASEIFRTGDGWWQPDDWGSWTKARGGALKMDVSHGRGPLRLFIGLMGLGTVETDFTVTILGATARQGRLAISETRWLSVLVPRSDYEAGPLHVTIKGSVTEDFALDTAGADTRVAGVGVYGFMICEDDDLKSRTDFLEAVTMKQLPDLADGWTSRIAAGSD